MPTLAPKTSSILASGQRVVKTASRAASLSTWPFEKVAPTADFRMKQGIFFCCYSTTSPSSVETDRTAERRAGAAPTLPKPARPRSSLMRRKSVATVTRRSAMAETERKYCLYQLAKVVAGPLLSPELAAPRPASPPPQPASTPRISPAPSPHSGDSLPRSSFVLPTHRFRGHFYPVTTGPGRVLGYPVASVAGGGDGVVSGRGGGTASR